MFKNVSTMTVFLFFELCLSASINSLKQKRVDQVANLI